jgi:hypothetical protein
MAYASSSGLVTINEIVVPQSEIHRERAPSSNGQSRRAKDQGLPAMLGMSCQVSDHNEADECGRTDLQGLVTFLDLLMHENVRLTEVAYCVNDWKLYGAIPLKHHGFVLTCGRFGFLSLDFTTKGILWDVDDAFPDLAENTCTAKIYNIDAHPKIVKQYCQKTKPFNWHSNDCAAWAAGLLRVLGVHDSKGKKRRDTIEDLMELEVDMDEVSNSDATNYVCKSRPRSAKAETMCGFPFFG